MATSAKTSSPKPFKASAPISTATPTTETATPKLRAGMSFSSAVRKCATRIVNRGEAELRTEASSLLICVSAYTVRLIGTVALSAPNTISRPTPKATRAAVARSVASEKQSGQPHPRGNDGDHGQIPKRDLNREEQSAPQHG